MKEKENWKTDGNCEECRRRNYCSKPCTANKRRTERIVSNAVYGMFRSILSK